jgi:hypothetical protein
MLEQRRSILYQRDRAMQRMGLATQQLQLRTGCGTISGFGKPLLLEGQYLIGSQYQPTR